jgi:acyl-CoA synthetase (AMP-forming)/AMP-acid ligase II
MILPDYLARAARSSPRKDAVIQGERRISYGQLYEGAERFAAFLLAEGFRPGERVTILLENSPEYVLCYFGVMKAGGVVVPLSNQTMARGIRTVVNDCTPTTLIVQDKHVGTVTETLPDLSSVCRTVTVSLGDIEGDKVDEPRPPDGFMGIRFHALSEILRASVSCEPFPGVNSTDLALILYTSGTTGFPKGVMLTHGNLSANAESIVSYLRLTAEDRVMAILPFYYSYGNSLLTTHVAAGGSLVLHNSFVFPNVLLDKMIQEEATGFSGVPSTFAILLNRSNIRKLSFPRLRYVTQAGGAMSPGHALELTRILPNAEIYIMYGQTEASARLSFLEPRELVRKAGSIGKAIPGVVLTVRTKEGAEASTGETGEIVASGENIMAGYWNQPEETARVLREDGLHTGDLARRDEEGFLFVVGRKSEMIKSGAHRISPKEIEEILLEIPTVHEVVVAGVEDEILGEAISAFIVLKEGPVPTEGEVLAHCRKNLPPFKVPKRVIFLAELPKTESGKVRRHELSKGQEPFLIRPKESREVRK